MFYISLRKKIKMLCRLMYSIVTCSVTLFHFMLLKIVSANYKQLCKLRNIYCHESLKHLEEKRLSFINAFFFISPSINKFLSSIIIFSFINKMPKRKIYIFHFIYRFSLAILIIKFSSLTFPIRHFFYPFSLIFPIFNRDKKFSTFLLYS